MQPQKAFDEYATTTRALGTIRKHILSRGSLAATKGNTGPSADPRQGEKLQASPKRARVAGT